jgi:hypothetical protein
MTMYLPNDHVRPTGAELAEFIDAAPAVEIGVGVTHELPPAAPSEELHDAFHAPDE